MSSYLLIVRFCDSDSKECWLRYFFIKPGQEAELPFDLLDGEFQQGILAPRKVGQLN